jgi:hypothetical protein
MKVMQTVAAIAAIGCVVGSALAQQQVADKNCYTKAGTMMYGLNGGFSMYDAKQKDVDTKVDLNVLKVAGEVDYFVIDNLSLGLAANLDYLYGNIKQPLPIIGSTKVKVDTLLTYGELVARYYVPVSERLIPYIGAEIGGGYAWGQVKVLGTKEDSHKFMWDWGGQLGFIVPLNERVFFDTCLKYTVYELPDSWNTDLNCLQILFGLKIKM